jgi:hypothetical protein
MVRIGVAATAHAVRERDGCRRLCSARIARHRGAKSTRRRAARTGSSSESTRLRATEAGEPAERLLEAWADRRGTPGVCARIAGIALPCTPCDLADWR